MQILVPRNSKRYDKIHETRYDETVNSNRGNIYPGSRKNCPNGRSPYIFPSLEEAQRACDKESWCTYVQKQGNWCGGSYELRYGNTYGYWKGLRSYRKVKLNRYEIKPAKSLGRCGTREGVKKTTCKTDKKIKNGLGFCHGLQTKDGIKDLSPGFYIQN